MTYLIHVMSPIFSIISIPLNLVFIVHFFLGAIFLFAYSLGYATPVVLASALSTSALGGALKGQGATWANSAFASLLIFYGTYTTFENVSKMFML